MQSVEFTLPTIDTAAMNRDDQGALLVNQATAVIVAAYLDYAAQGLQHGGASLQSLFAINATELYDIINQVQDRLRQF